MGGSSALAFRTIIAQVLYKQAKDMSKKTRGQLSFDIAREFEKKKRRGQVKAIPTPENNNDKNNCFQEFHE